MEIFRDNRELDRCVASRIGRLVAARRAEGRPAVLGLATGSTPVGVYRELIRMHREEGLDFQGVVAFNLDEYYPMDPDSVHSYRRFMRENFFDHVNIPQEARHIPRGDVPRSQAKEHCREYEARIQSAGGIDFMLLGIGRTGHIGFNEPGSGRSSRTRLLSLDSVTRADAAGGFFGEEHVPPEAITMGVATILDAREVALLATGEHKAPIVRRAAEGDIHPDVAATYLQEHSNATFYLDEPAASALTRVRTPWVVQEVDWTPSTVVQAVLWLSRRTKKPLLHLNSGDYREHHLGSLVSRRRSAGAINGQVFTELMGRIRGKSKLPKRRRILVFSPHPDDDVISMGGILGKLAENGNSITVAYQTSGNIAVFDHEVRRYLDFARRAAGAVGLGDSERVAGLARWISESLDGKAPGQIDIPEVREFKRVIRESEAVAALAELGISGDSARFLNLPFYRTGRIRKLPISEADVAIVERLIREIQPEIVFAAGDLADPHGTHRMCLEAVCAALQRSPCPDPELWLYRGAWQEWPLHEAEALVPLADFELRRKVQAIFRHESQKDSAPFPGPDAREFWQRVVDRNRGTADDFRRAGLPAYYAMEAFVTKTGPELRAFG